MTMAVDFTNLRDTVKELEEIDAESPLEEANSLYKAATTAEQLDEFLQRRIFQHEPVAYITGRCKFGGLDFKIDGRALIPRAETETLLDAGLEIPENASVADVGTGSGAVAISLKKMRPDLSITGIDIDKDALDLACVNADSHGVSIVWKDNDLLKGMQQDFDAILANLPYLPARHMADYPPEMTENEPEIALWGGSDGLDLIRLLLHQVSTRPSVKLIALETGLGQHEQVMSLVRATAFPIVYGITDKKEDIRAVVGKRG